MAMRTRGKMGYPAICPITMNTKGSKLQTFSLIASASDHLSTESLLKMKKELFHAAVKSEQVWPYIVLQGWGHR